MYVEKESYLLCSARIPEKDECLGSINFGISLDILGNGAHHEFQVRKNHPMLGKPQRAVPTTTIWFALMQTHRHVLVTAPT
jgi:hypothetical protein